MSERRLIIHAGFHKSGTTALQESLHANRKLLLSHGISYPSNGAKSHHRLAWSLMQKTWGWVDRGGERVPIKYWNRKIKEINASKSETVILSSEFFSELDGDLIRRFGSEVKSRKVSVLFTLRPLAKLLPSTYQQYLKYGTVAEYEDWLHSVLDKPGISTINPTFWVRHSHGKVIAKWADVLGKSNVTVLIVNEANPEFLFDEFNSYLGLPTKTIGAQESGSNRSLTMEEIALLLELNRQFPKERSWDEYEIFIRRGYIRELTDHVPAAPDKERLLTPQWAVDKANDLGAEIRNEINQLGVRVIGDFESLARATVPIGAPSYPTTIDIKTVAAAMLTFDRRTVGIFPIDWIHGNVAKRYRKKLKLSLNRFR